MDCTEGIVAVMTTGIVIGIPMMALSVRFALKPAIEAWAKARETPPPLRFSHGQAAELEALKLRVAALEVIWENRLGAGTLKPNVPPQLVD